jgi:opacity protein-like surface antigen
MSQVAMVEAQGFKNLTLGLHSGIAQSGTDTHTWGTRDEGIFDEAHILFGANIQYPIHKAFDVNLSYTRTSISGDDLNIEELADRGWSFDSPLSEIGLNLHWKFLSHNRDSSRKIHRADGSRVSFKNAQLLENTYYNQNGLMMQPEAFLSKSYTFKPYLLLGISSSYVKPELDFRLTPPDSDFRQFDLENQRTNYLHFALGLGANFQFTQHLSLDVEFKGIIPQYDQLDGMARVILPFNTDRNKDSYQFAILRLNYNLSSEKECDEDLLTNRYDKCPCTNGDLKFWGCPDTDKDGIADILDNCPNVPGEKQYDGCPDSDEDTVPDYLDECPETYGLVLFKGCPDRDADGVPDKDDQCPDTPGAKSNNGCPK